MEWSIFKMAELKTKKTTDSVEKFLNKVAEEQRRKDCFRVLEIMKTATKTEPAMWGTNIVGVGSHKYKYESGREGEWFLTGFSPRKDSLTLYLMSGLQRHSDLLKTLGKHKTGKGCLYIKKLDDVDLTALRRLIKQSVADLAAKKK
jgi:hypothetical protein